MAGRQVTGGAGTEEAGVGWWELVLCWRRLGLDCCLKQPRCIQASCGTCRLNSCQPAAVDSIRRLASRCVPAQQPSEELLRLVAAAVAALQDAAQKRLLLLLLLLPPWSLLGVAREAGTGKAVQHNGHSSRACREAAAITLAATAASCTGANAVIAACGCHTSRQGSLAEQPYKEVQLLPRAARAGAACRRKAAEAGVPKAAAAGAAGVRGFQVRAWGTGQQAQRGQQVQCLLVCQRRQYLQLQRQ